MQMQSSLVKVRRKTMKTWGILFVQYLFNLVMLRLADAPMTPSEDKKKLPTWAIILIVIGGLIVLCVIVGCLLSIFAPAVLALMGPSVGNVFSNVIEDME
jgi:hypothetical protein